MSYQTAHALLLLLSVAILVATALFIIWNF